MSEQLTNSMLSGETVAAGDVPVVPGAYWPDR